MTSEPILLDYQEPGAPPGNEVDASPSFDRSAAAIDEDAPGAEPEIKYDVVHEYEDDYQGYRYAPGPSFCEDNELYQPGGLHPVQIEDHIEDRYLIVHKLGSGGSSTVWLARDTVKERYVALKMVTADMSGCAEAEAEVYRNLHDSLPEDVREAFLLPLYDTFWIEGPNGKHLCLSMGISGPSLASFRHAEHMKIREDLVNVIAAQVVEGLSEMHKVGLVYGDLSAGNIAFTLPNLDHFSIQDLYNIFGNPESFEVMPARQTNHGWATIHAPEFVYPPLDFTGKTQIGLLRPEVKFIDFGASYLLPSDDDSAGWGYTLSYTDPVCLFFQKRPTQQSDIWSLACIIFELRSAVELFPEDGNGIWEELEARLGPIPQRWEDLEKAQDEEDAEAADSHGKEDEDMSTDGNGEDAMERDIDETDQPLPLDDAAGHDDDRSVDHMELTEDAIEQPVVQRDYSAIRPQAAMLAWSYLPMKVDELVRGYLMQRMGSLMANLRVDALKQHYGNMLSSIRSWFKKSPSVEAEAEAETPSPPLSPVKYYRRPERFRPVFFRFRGNDPTLHGQIANIGNHHPWHHLTIEERRERLERLNAELGECHREDTSDAALDRGPPPPGKLSAEEAADFEDLLTSLLRWEREDRVTLDAIREHPWLTKEYAPCSSEHWLQQYYRGCSYSGHDEQYI